MKLMEGACLLCGKPLQYFQTERELHCAFCKKTVMSNVCCEDGHYVCDACHAERGIEAILTHCKESSLTDPITLAQQMMDDPYIHMHGNEHHVLVGAALLTAYHNAGGELVLADALNEMKRRGGKYPGGACGFYGCCGAAVSAGMFLSIAMGTTPMSADSWGKANLLTASALQQIGKLGGPRCCKRNTFTAILAAVSFVDEQYGIHMTVPQKVTCRYFERNRQCKRNACPYYPKAEQKS